MLEDRGAAHFILMDADNGQVLSAGRGVVTSDNLFDCLSAEVSAPAVPRPPGDGHDLSGVERFEVASEDFESAVTSLQNNPQHIRNARLAIVAPKDHVFGLYRMFEMLAEHAPPVEDLRSMGHEPQAEVFRDYADARAWLLADDGESRTPDPDGWPAYP